MCNENQSISQCTQRQAKENSVSKVRTIKKKKTKSKRKKGTSTIIGVNQLNQTCGRGSGKTTGGTERPPPGINLTYVSQSKTSAFTWACPRSFSEAERQPVGVRYKSGGSISATPELVTRKLLVRSGSNFARARRNPIPQRAQNPRAPACPIFFPWGKNHPKKVEISLKKLGAFVITAAELSFIYVT